MKSKHQLNFTIERAVPGPGFHGSVALGGNTILEERVILSYDDRGEVQAMEQLVSFFASRLKSALSG